MRTTLCLLAAALCAASCSTVRRADPADPAARSARIARRAPAATAALPPAGAAPSDLRTAYSGQECYEPEGCSPEERGHAEECCAEAFSAERSCLLVSKRSMTLSVLDGRGRRIAVFPIACGEHYGDKRSEGDRRTPEGLFTVQEILDTSRWPSPADPDGEPRPSPYGPYFIRLRTPPHEGIGIHGTNDERSIGTRSSAGCIRLRNEELLRLLRYVRIGMAVFITPSERDEAAETEQP